MAKLIDLSHPLEHGQPNFPWDPKISVISHNTVTSIGYNITQVSLSSHQGTHLDAPFHFYDDGKTIDQMRLEQFYGPATLVDLAPGGQLKAKTPLTVEMFKPHAKKFQRGAKIIYRTGWSRNSVSSSARTARRPRRKRARVCGPKALRSGRWSSPGTTWSTSSTPRG